MKEIVLEQLYRIGAIKRGKFTLKNGAISPIYIDLRSIISYPIVLRQITTLLWEKASTLDWDVVCGVPYTALPLATALSVTYEKPMILRRKEAKNHGTKRMVEGAFEGGQSCLVIEDVVTTGSSILETMEDLEKEGLKLQHIVALLDREAGARDNLADKGYTLWSIFTLSKLLEYEAKFINL